MRCKKEKKYFEVLRALRRGKHNVKKISRTHRNCQTNGILKEQGLRSPVRCVNKGFVFTQTDKMKFTRFLKSHHSRTLETQVGLEIERFHAQDAEMAVNGSTVTHKERLFEACNDEVS